MNNKILIITAAILIGAAAQYIYNKTTNSNLVALQNTKSGKFILTEGHIYELIELEIVQKTESSFSEGGSQFYHLPTGKK